MRPLCPHEQRHTEGGKQQQQLAPRQAHPMPVKGQPRRRHHRRRDVQPHRHADQPPEVRRTLRRGLIHPALEARHRLTRTARGDATVARHRVEEGEVIVLQPQMLEVLPPDHLRLGIDDHQRPPHRPRIRHDVRRPSDPARRLAVPHHQQHVAPIHDLESSRQVRFLPRSRVRHDLHMLRSLQQRSHLHPVRRRKIPRKIILPQG